MRLQLRKMKHRHANCYVVPLGAGRALKFSKVGDITDDMEEEEAYEILGKHAQYLAPVKDDSELVMSSPKNKAAATPKAK